jgi:DNA-binding transcriptional LysR family regulator
MLTVRGVRWELAVEATGWELMQHFAVLGVGLAVVSDFCRVPKGAVARPLPDFAPIGYALVERAGTELPEPARRLRTLVVEAFEPRSGSA